MGSQGAAGTDTGLGGTAATWISGGIVCSIDAAQHAHVQRTQNAGQPLSGADSLVPIGQVSGTTSELRPLASAISTMSTAMNNARRTPMNISVPSRSRRNHAATSLWATFDTVQSVQHSRVVVWLIRRVSAVLAILTLCVGNVALCAGWQATAEARMECCRNEATCPMHKSESRNSGSRHKITQAQADNCCSGSERTQSTSTSSTFVASGIVALAPATVAVVTSPNVPALQEWRAFVPLPVPPVPKHLLLSVFLV